MQECLSKKQEKRLLKVAEERKKQVENGNDLFKKATKAEKRVMIAKDVLASLKSKRLKATPGSWLRVDVAIEDEDASLQEELFMVPQCEVCALGALFVCTVERYNKITVGDSGVGSDDVYDGTIFPYLEKFFSETQMNLIEAVFESNLGYADTTEDNVDWGRQFDPGTKRMTAIMKNIIENNGTFVVPKESTGAKRKEPEQRQAEYAENKDALKNRSAKAEKLAKIKHYLETTKKSDAAIAVLCGCSWVDVKVIREAKPYKSKNDIRRGEEFQGLDV